MTGRNVLRPELEKPVEFERKQRQGRQELVQQMGMENGGQMRASTGKDTPPLRLRRIAISGSQ
jgi:hypothetical protein